MKTLILISTLILLISIMILICIKTGSNEENVYLNYLDTIVEKGLEAKVLDISSNIYWIIDDDPINYNNIPQNIKIVDNPAFKKIDNSFFINQVMKIDSTNWNLIVNFENSNIGIFRFFEINNNFVLDTFILAQE